VPANYVIWQEEGTFISMTCLYHMMLLYLTPTWWKMVLLLCCSIYFISTKGLNLTLLSGPLSCGITKYFWPECQKTS